MEDGRRPAARSIKKLVYTATRRQSAKRQPLPPTPTMADPTSCKHLLIVMAILLLLSPASTNFASKVAHPVIQERIDAGIAGDQCQDQCGSSNGSQPTMCYCRNPDDCASRGDCCADRYFAEVKMPKLRCVPAFGRSLLAVTLCPDTWENDRTRLLCEGENRWNATYLQDLPVLGVTSKVLYRNVFCAICNGDTRKLFPWTLNLTCVPNKIFGAFSNGVAKSDAKVNYSIFTRMITVRWNGSIGRCLLRINELMPEDYAQTLSVTPCELIDYVRTCPPTYPDEGIRAKCHSYTSLVVDGRKLQIYRNYHCALCNQVNASALNCSNTSQFGPAVPPRGSGLSYAIVLDFSNWGNQENGGGSPAAAPSVGILNNCSREEVYDPILGECLPSACPADVCTKTDCVWTRVLRDDVVFQPDGSSIFVPKRDITLPPDLWRADETSLDHLLACFAIQREEAALRPVGFEDVLSTAVLLISVTCLFLHIAAYALVAKLRTGPARLLLCLAVSVLVAQSSFVAGGLIFMPGSEICTGLGILSHGAHLAAFFWMNVMAVDIQRTFRSGLRGSSKAGSRRTFLGYSSYAWLGPTFLVVGAMMVERFRPESPWSPAYGQPFCWLNRPLSLAAFFGLPVLLLLVANTVLFALTAHSIHSTKRQVSKLLVFWNVGRENEIKWYGSVGRVRLNYAT